MLWSGAAQCSTEDSLVAALSSLPRGTLLFSVRRRRAPAARLKSDPDAASKTPASLARPLKKLARSTVHVVEGGAAREEVAPGLVVEAAISGGPSFRKQGLILDTPGKEVEEASNASGPILPFEATFSERVRMIAGQGGGDKHS
ncbi:hypothetical protein BDK51DRAFT_40911 [Blyttiomyces helicus]|uniref:Uncharacterized protein n=1 Tax=Blyttiomyces helicus TaxID=388810 RepID=A0A4P9WIC9_9FUNG|nr:hypothetical protein BDK51DRAFT_40911 [Blyttiomyces helicus]|eukprot:RKO92172.1 hypothetical protein BDK51DRAFT_40911 [Blyttiomyces helicus]